jgi:hypothetical protein
MVATVGDGPWRQESQHGSVGRRWKSEAQRTLRRFRLRYRADLSEPPLGKVCSRRLSPGLRLAPTGLLQQDRRRPQNGLTTVKQLSDRINPRDAHRSRLTA